MTEGEYAEVYALIEELGWELCQETEWEALRLVRKKQGRSFPTWDDFRAGLDR